MNKRNSNICKVCILILIILLISYLIVHYDLYTFFTSKDKIIDFIQSFHPYDEIIFILLQITQVVAAPIPGELTGFIGGYLYGPVLGTIYSTIGLTLGSWIAFALAHFFGQPFIEKAVNKEVLVKFDRFMEHQGVLVSFFLFLIPGFPKDYLCYIMGVSSMRAVTFLIISAAGRLMGTIMLSVTGSSAREGHYLLLGCFVAVGIIIAIAAYYHHEKLMKMINDKCKPPEPDRRTHERRAEDKLRGNPPENTRNDN
jgi:uncharacterized membrane protein YdjX (TVP38/TMEM64 family)